MVEGVCAVGTWSGRPPPDEDATMRRLTTAALTLGLAALASTAIAADKPKGYCETGSVGTAIDFYDSPSEAAKDAKKDGKLVFVLHVSGMFEDPRFT